jgi:hypothetical protein
VSNQEVLLSEDYKIFDKLAKNKNANGPAGWVKIYLQTKSGIIYDEGSNLVTSQGREYVAQRVFNSYASSGVPRANWTNYIISHFAIGSGGSTLSSGVAPVVTLNGPYICDTSLLTTIPLGISGYLTSPDNVDLSVKPIAASEGSMLLESVDYAGGGVSCSNYTRMKCTCIIPSGEPTSGTVKIDEAGLFFVYGTSAKLFSHISFSPKWKEKESKMTLEWYILF